MPRLRTLLCNVIFFCGAHGAWAICVDENKPLPVAVLQDNPDAGEIIYHATEDSLRYHPWSSTSLTGQIHVVYHLAARHGVDAINKKFIHALETLPPHSYRLVVVLNIDDVFTGGSYLARKTFEQNARENSGHVTFVLDTDSHLKQVWCIMDQSSTIILVNASGEVIKVKDGLLSETEIHEYLQKILTTQPAGNGSFS